jgi:hypothetical protein
MACAELTGMRRFLTSEFTTVREREPDDGRDREFDGR